jgi:hypothetical protein
VIEREIEKKLLADLLPIIIFKGPDVTASGQIQKERLFRSVTLLPLYRL